MNNKIDDYKKILDIFNNTLKIGTKIIKYEKIKEKYFLKIDNIINNILKDNIFYIDNDYIADIPNLLLKEEENNKCRACSKTIEFLSEGDLLKYNQLLIIEYDKAGIKYHYTPIDNVLSNPKFDYYKSLTIYYNIMINILEPITGTSLKDIKDKKQVKSIILNFFGKIIV